jgi:hypothetical protein
VGSVTFTFRKNHDDWPSTSLGDIFRLIESSIVPRVSSSRLHTHDDCVAWRIQRVCGSTESGFQSSHHFPQSARSPMNSVVVLLVIVMVVDAFGGGVVPLGVMGLSQFVRLDSDIEPGTLNN